MALWALPINRSTNIYGFNGIFELRERDLQVSFCSWVHLFQRLLSVQSSLCFKTVSVWSQFLAIIFITFVCACRSSSVSVISEFSRPLLNVHFITLFLLNNYHHLSVLLHIVFSCFWSQRLSTGLAGELYHSNFISKKNIVWVLFFKIRGSNSDVL